VVSDEGFVPLVIARDVAAPALVRTAFARDFLGCLLIERVGPGRARQVALVERVEHFSIRLQE